MSGRRSLPLAAVATTLLVLPAVTGTGTAAAADPPDSLSVSDITLVEGSGGTTQFTFTVNGTCTPAAGATCSIGYNTIDGTATQTGDYTDQASGFDVPAGTFHVEVTIDVTADTDDEADETFDLEVLLFHSDNPTFVTAGFGTATITDDDPGTPAEWLSVSDLSLDEGSGDTRQFTFTINGVCVPPSGSTCAIAFNTINGTATDTDDYTDLGSGREFPAGSFHETVAIDVTADTTDEPDETFSLDVQLFHSDSPTFVLTADGTATIVDDDEPAPAAATINAFSGGGQSARPGAAFPQPLVARVRTSGGVAVPGAEVTFTVVSGSAHFPGGASSAVAYTGSNGRATAPTLTAGSTPGPVTVRATAVGATGAARFNETVLARPRADVRVTLSAPTSARAGSPVVITLAITNRGPATATGLTADLALPAGFTVTRAGGGSVGDGGRTVHFSLRSLASGRSATYTVTATTAEWLRGSKLLRAVTEATGVSDPNTGNNRTSRSISLRAPR